MDELEKMKQADLELQESIKNALGKKGVLDPYHYMI